MVHDTGPGVSSLTNVMVRYILLFILMIYLSSDYIAGHLKNMPIQNQYDINDATWGSTDTVFTGTEQAPQPSAELIDLTLRVGSKTMKQYNT